MAEDGVRRPEGTIQSYKESVHHQFVSTMINLDTLKNNSKSMYEDYWDGRKYNVSSNSKYSNRSFYWNIYYYLRHCISYHPNNLHTLILSYFLMYLNLSSYLQIDDEQILYRTV